MHQRLAASPEGEARNRFQFSIGPPPHQIIDQNKEPRWPALLDVCEAKPKSGVTSKSGKPPTPFDPHWKTCFEERAFQKKSRDSHCLFLPRHATARTNGDILSGPTRR